MLSRFCTLGWIRNNFAVQNAFRVLPRRFCLFFLSFSGKGVLHIDWLDAQIKRMEADRCIRMRDGSICNNICQ